MKRPQADRSTNYPARPRWRRLAYVALGLGLVIPVALLIWAYLWYIDWPAAPAPLPPQIAWAVEGQSEPVGTVFVYDFVGNFFDSEHLWRIELAPELVPVIVRSWGVPELGSAAELPAAFWRQPPYWWRPRPDGPSRYFMSSGFNPNGRGQDGTHYVFLYNEAEGALYAWVKNNF